MLYDENNARQLLGALMMNPQLLRSDKYPLTKNDFVCHDFHMRMFQAIAYLSEHGAKSVDAIDIYDTCKEYPSITALFDNNNLIDFCQTIKQLTKINNFDYYYEEVRKRTLLREYQSKGFDISQFEADVTHTTIAEIIDYYDGINIAVKKAFYKNKDISESKAGDGFEDIKALFMQEPMFGATTFSNLMNTAARGWIDGQLSIYSCPSGAGKTTVGLYNLAKVCCTEMYDRKLKKYVPNPCYMHKGGLFLQYELDTKTELTPKLIASISDVPCFHILNGEYEGDEEARVDYAIKVLHDSNIHIVTMPSFTVGLIENYIRDYVINHDVGYVVFDYISSQASVSSDIAKSNGTATRDDQVLATIASKLKDIAVDNHIAILTFTQVNANINTQEKLDAGCIAGSRAVQNKADVGVVFAKLRKKEQEVCDMIMENKYNGSNFKPNRILHCYKMRFSQEEQDIKIWVHLNLNTGRVTDFWVTDADDREYVMQGTNLVYKE